MITWLESSIETINVNINWPDGVYAYPEGTPMDANGNAANSGKAIGLLLHGVKWPERSAQILVHGIVDLQKVNAYYGSNLTDGAKNAMSGIRFYDHASGGFWSDTLGASILQSAKTYTNNKVAEAKDYIVLKSSTASSTKQFKVTVDDDGELTATEITE